jgi:hypothetical protein
MSEKAKSLLNLKVFSKSGQRSVHKPLLVLYALGRCFCGRQRLMPFREINVELPDLFSIISPEKTSEFNAHYPFVRLESDGVWEIANSKAFVRNSSGDVSKTDLLEMDAWGGFSEEIFNELRGNKEYIERLVMNILEMHFDPNVHERILSALVVFRKSKPDGHEIRDISMGYYQTQASRTANAAAWWNILHGLQEYYKSCRYQGVALTIKDLSVTDTLADTLRSHFESFECWQKPGQEPAPPLECYVREFCRQAFQCERPGLIIVEPENWLFQWNKANQQSFWSNLSEHYGRFPVIVVAKGANETTAFLEHYFRAAPFDDDTVRGWISKYQND